MSGKFTKEALFDDLRGSIDWSDLNSLHVKLVFNFAFEAHGGQFRDKSEKNDSIAIPYITHPVGVAKLAAMYFHAASLDDSFANIIDTCLLHDVIEDTPADLAELSKLTSERVIELVFALTKPTAFRNETRQSRNKKFLNQIREAGKSAAFIKLMDSMHNLSRPTNMPLKLLEKSVQKSRSDYAPLLTFFDFNAEIADKYNSILLNAANNIQQPNIRTKNPKDLQIYLQICFSRLAGKVLEVHDILELIMMIPGIKLLFEGTIENFLKGYLESRMNINSNQLSNIKKKMFEGLPLQDDINFAINNHKTSINNIIALRLDDLVIDSEHRKYFFLLRDHKNTPEWVTWELLQSIIGLLAERYRNWQGRQITEIAELLSKTNLVLSPSLAIEAQLALKEIKQLRVLLDRANFFLSAISAELNNFMRTIWLQESYQIALEKRIKSPKSIVQKKILRNLNSIFEVDDILGLRLVMPSQYHVEKLSSLIVEKFTKATTPFFTLIKDVDCHQIDSQSGYSARHILFRCIDHENADIQVSCEIQIRTIFQDAWAKLSHTTSYKSENITTKKPHRESLKVLAKKCSEIDEMINILFTNK